MRAAAVVLVALFLAGCGDLVSLHPFFTKSDQVFDPAVEGRWGNDDDTLTVERREDAYQVVLRSKKDAADKQTYEAHLVDVAGVRFADLVAEDEIGHMLIRLRTSATELRLSFLDSGWLRQRVAHEESEVDAGKTRAVLTMRPPQLRSMVAKYAKEPKAYDHEDIVFSRSK